MSGRFPPLVLLGIGAIALLSLTGCRTTADIRIELDEAGVGHVAVSVELDDAAAERVGNLSELLALEDLEGTGWDVTASERTVLARHEVRSPAELELALADLGGPEGIFSDLEFERRETFARTAVGVSGAVDLSAGMSAFGDEDLARLTGSITGVDLPADSIALALEVDLPGEEEANGPGGKARWSLPVGEVTHVKAESTDLNLLGLVAVAVALACAGVIGGVLIRRLRP